MMASDKIPVLLTIVRGEARYAHGVEFGLAGIDVDDEVYEWFDAFNAGDDPDVWVLVTTTDHVCGIDLPNQLAMREVMATCYAGRIPCERCGFEEYCPRCQRTYIFSRSHSAPCAYCGGEGHSACQCDVQVL